LTALKVTEKQRWNLEKMKDEGTAMNYKCEIDTAVVAEKKESADLNDRWNTLSQLIYATNIWVTDEMTDMLQERTKWKTYISKKATKYISQNNYLCQIIDKEREKWWDEQCAELQKHETRKDGSFIKEGVTVN